MSEEKALTVSAIVMPAVTKEEAVRAFNAYQELAKEILRPEDVQKIAGKDFKKKSFWRKCQRFFNVSLQIVSEVREEINGVFTYKFTVRATAPNGAYMDATGACSSDEKGLLKTEHNTRAIAETRAKNRAISDLVAFGEVSAEEIVEDTKVVQNNNHHYDTISEKQAKRFYAISNGSRIPAQTIKDYLRNTFGVEDAQKLKPEFYDDACHWAKNWKE